MTASSIEVWPLDRLTPYARNARTHSPEQVAKIAASIAEFGFNNPILVSSDSGIIAGHGRFAAAALLKLASVPVIRLDHLSDAQRRAYILADNRLAELAGWDVDMLRAELVDLDAEGGDLLGAAGFSDEELTAFLGDGVLPDGSRVATAGTEGSKGRGPEYSKKIVAPIYEAKGEKPEIATLADMKRTRAMREEIMAAEISEEEREFLLAAANRHTVFDYHNIAEFYCHASPAMQALMEASALVIIDFDKAIERGYVEMSEQINAIYFSSFGNDDESEDDEG
jgi:hypothetical protein